MEEVFVAWNLGIQKSEIGLMETRGNGNGDGRMKRISRMGVISLLEKGSCPSSTSILKFCCPKEVQEYFATFSPNVKENPVLLHGYLQMK